MPPVRLDNIGVVKRIAVVCLLLVSAGVSLADSWTPVAPMPTPRKYLGAAAPWGATIFAIGGMLGGAGSTIYYDTNEMYDASTDIWTTLAPMPTPRAGLVVSGVGGSIYAVGGGVGDVVMTLNEAYDPYTDSWDTRAPMQGPRRWAAGGAVGGKLYVMGGVVGVVGSVVSSTILNTTEMYDPATNTWTSKALMPTPRFLHAAVVVGGKIWCVGGVTALIGGPSLGNVKIVYVSAVEVYDPATDTWAVKAPMPVPRAGAGAASPGNGMIYVAGGMTDGKTTDVCERYNPVADRWDDRAPFQLPPSPAAGRMGLAVAAPPSTTAMYAIGGESSTLASYDNAGRWVTSGTVYGVSERYDRDPARLVAAVSVQPGRVRVGMSASLFVDFTNLGDAATNTYVVEAEVVSGSGSVSLAGAPVAATWFSGSLTPGATGRYVWNVAANAAGEIYFSATPTAIDAEWLNPLAALAWNDMPLTCAYPARLVSSVTVAPLPIVPGGQLRVYFTVTNEGGGTVFNASARIAVSPPGAPVAIVAGPPLTSTVNVSAYVSGTVFLGPLTSTTFVWTFSVTGAGYALFSCFAGGLDPLFGTVTTTGNRSTTPSAPGGLVTRQGDGAALLTWNPNPAWENVTTYRVYRSSTPGVTPSSLLVGTTSDTWFDDSGIVNGARYYYIVTAANADGTGPPSAEISVVPANIPGVPGDVRVVCTGPTRLSFNPDRGERVQFLINSPPGAGTLRVTVYTLAGEQVREVLHTALPPGKQILEWDGRNAKGRVVASGGYLAVFEMPDGKRAIRKMAVVR